MSNTINTQYALVDDAAVLGLGVSVIDAENDCESNGYNVDSLELIEVTPALVAALSVDPCAARWELGGGVFGTQSESSTTNLSEWRATKIDTSDSCGVDGAVTVHLVDGATGDEATALMYESHNGWRVYGDCADMWLGSEWINELSADQRELDEIESAAVVALLDSGIH